MQETNLLIILGATASGKTKLAVEIAHALGSEIISADSRQIFKGMDIGTGKDLNEYNLGGKSIPHHLIDILPAGARYHVDAFKTDFYQAFATIRQKNKFPILCGGTGMYINSILQNQKFTSVPVDAVYREKIELLPKSELVKKLAEYPEEQIKHVDVASHKRLVRALEIARYLKHNPLPEIERPLIKPVVFGLKSEVEATRSRIQLRLKDRLQNGMIKEVENLVANGLTHEMLSFYGLEYKFISKYVLGELTLDELSLHLGTAICQYAKRQNTFFRKMEKDGVHINWLDAAVSTRELKQRILEIVLKKIKS